MTPERWRRITDVFHLARARNVGARAAILDEAYGGDLTLRGDVEKMLAGDDQVGQFGVDDGERMLREAMANDVPTVEDQIQLAIIDLKRGRLEAAATGFRKVVPRWGYFWRPEIARHYLEAGLPGPALEHLNETFRVDPPCAQWLMSTQSPYWTPIRANLQARALFEKYRPPQRTS